METRTSNLSVDPDFAPQIVDDLYRYRPRYLWIARLLAIPLGFLGAHRFYCGKPFTGLLMLLTVGGALAWWIWDAVYLRQMVQQCNANEIERQKAGLPPQGMGFLPPRNELKLDCAPAWAARRSGRGRIVGSAVLLALIGVSLGAASRATQAYEPVFVMVLFIAVSLVAARWQGITRVPVLNALARWVHRLRLYYHVVDPGHVAWLAVRPVLGIFIAPWRPKIRTEVRLHLQLGIVVAVLFAAMDVVEVTAANGIADGIVMLITEFAKTLVYTYLFVAPAVALLTTQLLLAKRDHVVWLLSAITLGGLYSGLTL